MRRAIAIRCLPVVLLVVHRVTLSGQQVDRRFEELRQAAIEKARAEWQKEAETPEFVQRQREIDRVSLPIHSTTQKELEAIRKSALIIRARALSVSNDAILAAIRVKKQLPRAKGSKAPRFTISDELADPYYIVGLDTSDIVDNDTVDLTVYLAGKHSYHAVSGAWKTVRRFATSPELAARLLREKQ